MDAVQINFYAAQWWRDYDRSRYLASATMTTEKIPFPPIIVTSALDCGRGGMV